MPTVQAKTAINRSRFPFKQTTFSHQVSPESLLQPAQAVCGDLVATARLEELGDFLQQVGGGCEAAGGQPHQLPAPLLGQPVTVVRQLLDDLAVDFITEDLLQWWCGAMVIGLLFYSIL